MPNQEIMREWVARLRSGKYEQGRNYLQADGKFCCLGVLCEIAVERGVIPAPYHTSDIMPSLVQDVVRTIRVPLAIYAGSGSMPTRPVLAWADVPTGSITAYDNDELFGTNTLAFYNDSGKMTFSQIADVIEERWIELGAVVPDTPAEIVEETVDATA